MLRDSFIRYLIVAFGCMIFMAVSLGKAEIPTSLSESSGMDYDGVNPGNDSDRHFLMPWMAH